MFIVLQVQLCNGSKYPVKKCRGNIHFEGILKQNKSDFWNYLFCSLFSSAVQSESTNFYHIWYVGLFWLYIEALSTNK